MTDKASENVIRVDLEWDASAKVFVGTSKDCRGLVLEEGSKEEVEEKAPVLLETLRVLNRESIPAGFQVKYNYV